MSKIFWAIRLLLGGGKTAIGIMQAVAVIWSDLAAQCGYTFNGAPLTREMLFDALTSLWASAPGIVAVVTMIIGTAHKYWKWRNMKGEFSPGPLR